MYHVIRTHGATHLHLRTFSFGDGCTYYLGRNNLAKFILSATDTHSRIRVSSNQAFIKWLQSPPLWTPLTVLIRHQGGNLCLPSRTGLLSTLPQHERLFNM